MAVASPVTGSNLMYTVHFYACTHGASALATAADALSAGVPIFVTEWGATLYDGGAGGTPICAAEADDWHDWMNANAISWAAWKLDDCDFELMDPGVADTSCLLAPDAPLDGGWTSEYQNGHAPYVIGKMLE